MPANSSIRICSTGAGLLRRRSRSFPWNPAAHPPRARAGGELLLKAEDAR